MGLDVYLSEKKTVCVFDANITHNLTDMANEAGIYKYVWRPEENGIKFAKDLIPHLERGIKLMTNDPNRFLKHNPSNGWGSYGDFVEWLCDYLDACKKNPKAKIRVSR